MFCIDLKYKSGVLIPIVAPNPQKSILLSEKWKSFGYIWTLILSANNSTLKFPLVQLDEDRLNALVIVVSVRPSMGTVDVAVVL